MQVRCSIILIDVSEPAEIERMLAQTTIVVRSPLNKREISDYFFGSIDGRTLQFGRVQAGELLANIDSMEDELRRYYNSATENYQIVEGIISPVPLNQFTDKQVYAIKSGKISWGQLQYEPKVKASALPTSRPTPRALSFSYHVEYVTDKEGVEMGVMAGARAHDVSISLLYVWIHRLACAGISTYFTVNWIETARLLSLVYKNEQKSPEEHTTLQRIVRPRLQLKEQEPFVRALVYLSAAMKIDIGEKTALLIAEKFANIGDLYLASVEDLTEIKGIGRITAEKILRALGRSIE